LTELYLSNNQLADISPLSSLASLTELYLDNNQLADISHLSSLTSLTELGTDHNPLKDEYVRIEREEGSSGLLTYLRSVGEGAEELYEAKLVLVGKGDVGKTCLQEVMRELPFNPNSKTTHGIERHDLPMTCMKEPHSDKTLTMKIWDFGGQDEYRVTHQFFFSTQAIYLVVWKPRADVTRDEVGEWIDLIRQRVGLNAKVLVVATHCDHDRITRIDKDSLMRQYPGMIQGFYEIDSADGPDAERLAVLKEAIVDVASTLDHIGEMWPNKYIATRDRMTELAADRTHLSYSEFMAECHQGNIKERLTDEQANQLLGRLDTLGYVVYHGRSSLNRHLIGESERCGLDDMVVLQPEWLTKAISFVLENKKTANENGVLEHDRLAEIWNNPARSNHYPPKWYPYFLGMMEKFLVCYRLGKKPRQSSSLVPQMLPTKQPEELSEVWPEETDADTKEVRLVCELTAEPIGLLPWLIVRTHRYSMHNFHWLYGAVLDYGTHGKVRVEQQEKRILLTARAENESPGHAMSLISQTLEELIKDELPGLNDFNWHVPCYKPANSMICDGNGLLRLERVRNREVMGRPTTECLLCGEDLEVPRLLRGFSPERKDIAEVLSELDEMRAEIRQLLEAAGEERQRYAGRTDELIHALMRMLNDVAQDGPRLFSMIPEPNRIFNPRNWDSIPYWLTLWCEMPGCQHPVSKIFSGGAGDYPFRIDRSWWKKCGPWVKVATQILGALVPVAGAGGKAAAVSAGASAQLSANIDLMEKTVSSLLKINQDVARAMSDSIDSQMGQTPGLQKSFEGENLRAFHRFLRELDKDRHPKFGGLQKTDDETGTCLWLCPEHFKVYNPDLPEV
jgi:hypothetical protein